VSWRAILEYDEHWRCHHLANPEVVEEIRKMVQGEGVVVTKEGRRFEKFWLEER